MKQYYFLIVCLLICGVCFSGCNLNKNEKTMIKSERRLGKYIEANQQIKGNVIDLSEGPKLKYNANFGPKDVDFDFKIVNPY